MYLRQTLLTPWFTSKIDRILLQLHLLICCNGVKIPGNEFCGTESPRQQKFHETVTPWNFFHVWNFCSWSRKGWELKVLSSFMRFHNFGYIGGSKIFHITLLCRWDGELSARTDSLTGCRGVLWPPVIALIAVVITWRGASIHLTTRSTDISIRTTASLFTFTVRLLRHNGRDGITFTIEFLLLPLLASQSTVEDNNHGSNVYEIKQ